MSESGDILLATDVVKRFAGLTAVNKMNFNLEAGRIYSIIGPNRAGKTTFFNAVSGLYPPEEGTIVFDGQRIERLSADRITALHMARTFQNIRLFGGMTVVENILKPDRKLVRRPARSGSRELPVWTVDDPAQAKRLLTLGCAGIISNRPQDLGILKQG